MTAPPGLGPDLSTTARLADKGASAPFGDPFIEPSLERRAVTALVELSEAAGAPLRRAEARAIVKARGGFESLAEIDEWLRSTFRMDPTGVSAVRNVSRGSA